MFDYRTVFLAFYEAYNLSISLIAVTSPLIVPFLIYLDEAFAFLVLFYAKSVIQLLLYVGDLSE